MIFDALGVLSVISIGYGLSQIYTPGVYLFLGLVGGWVALKGAKRSKSK